MRIIYRSILVSFSFLFFLAIFFRFLPQDAYAATITWDGGGGDNNWSTGDNWSTNGVPSASDDVVFDGTSTKASTIDASFGGAVKSLSINSGYTGGTAIITQARSMIFGPNGDSFNTNLTRFSQAAGTFVGSSDAITIWGNFSLSTGSFTSTSGTMTVKGNFSITGGTFIHNSGTITFNEARNDVGNIACNGATFNLIIINPVSVTYATTIGSDCTIPLGNSPTTKGHVSNSGTVTIGTGTWTINGTYIGNSGGILTMTGSEISLGGSFSLDTSSTFPTNKNLTLTSTGYLGCGSVTFGTVTVNTSGLNYLSANCSISIFTLTSGEFSLNGQTLSVSGNFANNGGTFTAASGVVVLTGTNQTMSGSTTFYDLTKIVSSADTLTFTSGTTQTIQHTLTLQGAASQLLSLRSSNVGSAWNITADGDRTINYLDVQDSYNTDSSHLINAVGANITNSLRNTNWNFSSPGSPGSLIPTSGGYVSTLTPTVGFSVSDSDSADSVKYTIQIATDADFSSIIIDYTSSLGTCMGNRSFTVGQSEGSGTYNNGHNATSLSDNTSYYWRVKAIDSSGNSTSFVTAHSGGVGFKTDTSTPAKLSTPTTNAPTTSNTKPTWTWNATSDTNSTIYYVLEWSTDQTFADFSVSSSSSSGSSGMCTGFSSPSDEFTSSTATATTTSISLGFTASNSSTYGDTYNLSSANTSRSGLTVLTSPTFTHSSDLRDGTWYLRVRAVDGADHNGAFSSAGTVIIDTTTPSELKLDSPLDSVYTHNAHELFRWKAGTDAATLTSYSLAINNSGSKDYSITNISPTGTQDVVTDKYTIHYDGFDDTDASNNYVSVYTTPSTRWGNGENYGELAEGTVVWTVTSYNATGSTATASRTLYVDFSPPTITNLSLYQNAGTVGGYTVTENKTPHISGVITDNFFPTKVHMVLYKQQYVFGTLQSRTVYYSGSITLNNTAQKPQLTFSFTPDILLEYGKYQLVVTGEDEAENFSAQATLLIQLLPPDKLETMHTNKKQVAHTDTPIVLRRYQEADELARLIAWIKNMCGRVWIAVKEGTTTIAIAIQDRSTTGYDKKVSDHLAKTQHATFLAVSLFLQPVNDKSTAIDKHVIASQKRLQKVVLAQHKDTTKAITQTGYAAHIGANYALHNPTDNSVNLFERMKIGSEVFYAYVFGREPTRIDHVKLDNVTTSSVTISWKTNQPTINNKVNYGTTTSYGQSAWSTDGFPNHTVTVGNLASHKTYYFEVMSQGKNYTYDAYYSFTTK